MRNRKILATAITAALAGSLGAGGVSAGMKDVTYPDTGYKTPPMSVATEDIALGQTLPSNCATNKITVVYITDTDLATNTQVKFTLKEGTDVGDAVFQTQNTIPSASTNPSNISPSTFTVAQTGSSTSVLSLIEGGEGASTMAFRIQETVAKNSTLTFSFCIYKADVLQDADESINLGIDVLNDAGAAVAGESVGSYSVLTAKNGTAGVVNAGVDDTKVKVNIGADAGAKKFTGSSVDQTEQLTAILGQVCLQDSGGLYGKLLNLPLWTLAANATNATFSIVNAPFNASIGHAVPADLATATAEQLAGVMVFLDLNGDSKFDAGDIPADTVDTTNANFVIDETELDDLLITANDARTNVNKFNNSKAGCAAVVFKASGNDEIKTLKVAPTGKLTVYFGTVSREISGSLNHIKRSGTVCVLYNIPGPNSVEHANVRIINKSAVPDGTLIGTLRLPDGTEIFTDYDILTAGGLGLIGPNQTMYFNTETLETIAKSATNPNGVWDKGWTRAILRLESNLDYVEMMALIRDDDVAGAPLMNMSAGASGNGCGR